MCALQFEDRTIVDVSETQSINREHLPLPLEFPRHKSVAASAARCLLGPIGTAIIPGKMLATANTSHPAATASASLSPTTNSIRTPGCSPLGIDRRAEENAGHDGSGRFSFSNPRAPKRTTSRRSRLAISKMNGRQMLRKEITAAETGGAQNLCSVARRRFPLHICEKVVAKVHYLAFNA
jgi:hypothetical protein